MICYHSFTKIPLHSNNWSTYIILFNNKTCLSINDIMGCLEFIRLGVHVYTTFIVVVTTCLTYYHNYLIILPKILRSKDITLPMHAT